MAKQLFRRYVWLIDTIKSADGITMEEINRKWRRSILNESGEDIPLRTFHAYKDAIWDEFEIEIVCDRRDNKYRIAETYDAYGSVKANLIDAMIMDNALREIPSIRNCIIPNGAVPNRSNATIIQAIKDGKSIRFRYHLGYIGTPPPDADPEGLNQWTVLDPYGMYFVYEWFLIGYNRAVNMILVFKLSNVHDISLYDREYTVPEDFDVKSFGDQYDFDEVQKSKPYNDMFKTMRFVFDDGFDFTLQKRRPAP